MFENDEDQPELLFFDTFSHDMTEFHSQKLNLDLVQFPKPVYITEVRIIPLGARVQADFPGGVRLGATNPSQFQIEFFVNDLAKPGASTFECLGDFEYNQNNKIHLECCISESYPRKIPTDGLVLKGLYTTITLAVYGTFTKNITEPIELAQEPIVQPIEVVVAAPIEIAQEPIEVPTIPTQVAVEYQMTPVDTVYYGSTAPEPFENREYEYYDNDAPKDPRLTASANKRTTAPTSDWSKDEDTKDDEIMTTEKRSRRKSVSPSYERNRSRYSRSPSPCHEYSTTKRDWSRSPEYRSRRKRSSSYDRRSYERDSRRPRSPTDSPRRPRSPDHQGSSICSDEEVNVSRKFEKAQPVRVIERPIKNSPASTSGTPLESPPVNAAEDDSMSVGEQFEPILSDEDIGEDFEYTDIDYEFNDADDPKAFNPFAVTLQKYETLEDDRELVKHFDSLRKLMTCTKYSADSFLTETDDFKEAFVDFAEHVVLVLNQIYNLESHEKVNDYFKVMMDDKWEGIDGLKACSKIGLDIELAMSHVQPGYKLRHMKSGIRLTEFLCCYEEFTRILIHEEKFDVFQRLYEIFNQPIMALSIKLMIIKSMYSTLNTKSGIDYFLHGDFDGYKFLIGLIQENPSTRISFALKSLMKKINLYETLELINMTAVDFCMGKKAITDDKVTILQDCFNELTKACTWDELSYSQPKRFLPVSAKFEIARDSASDAATNLTFMSYFKIHNLLESIVLLLGHKMDLTPALVSVIYEFVLVLLKKYHKLEYFVDNIDATNALVKILMQNSEDDEDLNDLSRSQMIGVEISYKVQTIYFLNAIANTKGNVDKLVEYLQSFFYLANGFGRKYVVETICMDNNLIPLLDLIEGEKKLYKEEGSPGPKCKNPVLSYTIDLVDLAVRYCENLKFVDIHGKALLNLVKQHEIFEPSVCAMLQEIGVYLKPLEFQEAFHYDDIGTLVEIMKRSLEYVTTFPGDLIMSLRMIRHLGIADFDDNYGAHHSELKYKYMILQFYAADGAALIIQILEKMNQHYDQPGIHAASLVGNQGVLLTQILLPAVQILKKMITYVIQCRNTEFKDLTAVEHLLKTYALMQSFPVCALAISEARKVQDEILQIFLTYTQPTLDMDNIHKSLWTLMIGDIIKFILHGPYCFIPGLLVFSELLPLPLPVPCRQEITDREKSKLITERQLWSAHLHPQSQLISEMIQSICTSSYPQVLVILSRVCLQLSDLAPNMTLLVSRAIAELILNEPLINGNMASSQHARLYNFLSSLVCHASVKVSVMSVLPGKLMELMNIILVNVHTSPVHIQTQENIFIIFQNLLDTEISVMSGANMHTPPELLLACALPPKEIVQNIVAIVIEAIANEAVVIQAYISALRTMLLMTEHDVTMATLVQAIDRKRDQIYTTTLKIVQKYKESPEPFRPLIILLFEFLRSLFVIDEADIVGLNLPKKTLKLSPKQLGYLFKWELSIENQEPAAEGEEKPQHFLQILKELPKNEDVPKDDIEENFNMMLDYLGDAKADGPADYNFESISLDNIPQAEGIVTQYGSRAVYIISEDFGDQLKTNYWLNFAPCEDEIDMEQIPCDLQEFSKNCLSIETNLTSDCKRLLHLSASPQSTRDRITTAPCFRTRRIEVEPTTGRPEKKLFATPIRGRGFSRAPITRGDLFRSRPPNTSRPPSLHVDDFLALETCGAQPTGPTGYNKLSRDIITIRGRGSGRRGRGSNHWQSGSSSNWNQSHDPNGSQGGQHFTHHHFGAPPIRARASRGFSRYSRAYPR